MSDETLKIPKIAKLKPLKPAHARFVEEYLIDQNGAAAARRAGYTRYETAYDLMKRPDVVAAIKVGLDRVSKATETDAEWVRRRLREEAEDFTEFSSQAARVRAIELIARLNGQFAQDNTQQSGLAALVTALSGNVMKPIPTAAYPDDTELLEDDS